jgi:KaiC/GvpD/RAD55 family RecA-like ATPase
MEPGCLTTRFLRCVPHKVVCLADRHAQNNWTVISFDKLRVHFQGIHLSLVQRVRIPLIDPFVPGGINAGTVLIAEYDPDSQWVSVITTIAAEYLKAKGRVGYMIFTRTPADFKRDLALLGIDVESVQREQRLQIYDWYSATLYGGRTQRGESADVIEKISDGILVRSIKMADLSVQWLKDTKYGPQPEDVIETWPPGTLAVGEAVSTLLRFNNENDVLEWIETRVIPVERRARRVAIWGFVRGIHSEAFYKRLEAMSGGVIDLKIMEHGESVKNFLRVRSLKGQPCDSRWHEVQVCANAEATILQ